MVGANGRGGVIGCLHVKLLPIDCHIRVFFCHLPVICLPIDCGIAPLVRGIVVAV